MDISIDSRSRIRTSHARIQECFDSLKELRDMHAISSIMEKMKEVYLVKEDIAITEAAENRVRRSVDEDIESAQRLVAYSPIIQRSIEMLDTNLHSISERKHIPVLLIHNQEHLLHEIAYMDTSPLPVSRADRIECHQVMKTYKLLHDKVDAIEELLVMYKMILDKLDIVVRFAHRRM